MVRLTYKWNFTLFSLLCLTIVTYSLPILHVLRSPETDLKITDLLNDGDELSVAGEVSEKLTDVRRNATGLSSANLNKKIEAAENERSGTVRNVVQSSQVRPGQEANQYTIELTRDGNNIRGRASISITLSEETRADPIILHFEDLTFERLTVALFTGTNIEATHNVGNGVLRISPELSGTRFTVLVEYTMPLRNDGRGIFITSIDDIDYIAMNLHPNNARRVFPCMDEPNIISSVSFTFNDFEYDNIVSNSQLVADSQTEFTTLPGSLHTWGMVAHNLNIINLPTNGVWLYVRPGITNQDGQASVAINVYFNNLNEWTGKPYLQMINGQDGRMNIFSLPDTNRDWYALSTVCIWEPYILMEVAHSVRQRTTALATIAEAMSRQWFGYSIYPQNFRFQWVITGLAKYTGFEIFKEFQTNPDGDDINLLDVNAIFTTEIIQESLLRDAYVVSQPIEPSQNVFDENQIRETVNGLINYKAPAIMRMLRIVLGDEDQDFIKSAARTLLRRHDLSSITAMQFYDGIISEWLFEGNEIIDSVADFAQTWVENTGYPMLHVGLMQGGLLLTQERFSFTPGQQRHFLVPITYTTGTNANFENVHPEMMLDITTTLTLDLGEEDYVIFNIQGQGYYRVNYDVELWIRIMDALYDPDRRGAIHPLNRATLIDDSLNLARAGKLDYDIAFDVVLTMEMETEYPAWKAYVRNMEFLRKHVMLYVDDEDLDEDVYVRLLGRTIEAFEEEIGFEPAPNTNVPAMVSLTRGLVMEHACRANYDPCVAAAVDLFFDPNDIEAVNPNIPHDIRPAVYCTMVREGDEEVVNALEARLEEERSHYERIVIYEAMACSQDNDFIERLLLRTIADDSPYGVEEKMKIFKAVAESSNGNLDVTISFLSRNTGAIRDRYGGSDRLEDLLYIVGNNIVGPFQLDQFTNWVNSVNSDLHDSTDAARRARDQALENMRWRDANIEAIYEWMIENDAPKIVVSSFLILVSLCIALFNIER